MTRKTGYNRLRKYAKSGAVLHIPERVTKDRDFPFRDDDIVKVEISEKRMILRKVQWWEILDWRKMHDTFEKLPISLKRKIRNAGLVKGR